MNNWDKETHRKNHKNPSFSSTLLDEIYRSIDATDEMSKDSKSQNREKKYMVEKWVNDKGFTQKRPSSLPEMGIDDPLFYTSTSSSSDSSSEAEFSRTKPMRKREKQNESYLFDGHQNQKSGTSEEKTIKSKSRALKIYANLKKVKEPISPGGRLTTFLNSLFTNGNNMKKEKISRTKASSTCSSFTRSCLSKTPPSWRKNGVKRSVTFNPVGLIFDEDCRPCGHKRIYDHDSDECQSSNSQGNATELKLYDMMEKKGRFEAVKSDVLKRYLHLKKKEYDARDYGGYEDEDEVASDASSDLFEIDHLAGKTFCDELPVYETTHMDSNRAIARGFVY